MLRARLPIHLVMPPPDRDTRSRYGIRLSRGKRRPMLHQAPILHPGIRRPNRLRLGCQALAPRQGAKALGSARSCFDNAPADISACGVSGTCAKCVPARQPSSQAADFKVAAGCAGEFIDVYTHRIRGLVRCSLVQRSAQQSIGAGVKNEVKPPSLNPTVALVMS